MQRDYFDRTPYGNLPREVSHANNMELLYVHNLLTSHYLRHRTWTQTEGKWILDAGCGSGLKTLALAQANPGARLVAIDVSPMSIAAAHERLTYHGADAQFHVLPVERVAELGLLFDYINCDEVLYLLPDPAEGLAALASVLAPGGILRANLHDRHQRALVYRAQEAFKLLSSRAGARGEGQVDLVYRVMDALRDDTLVKQQIWLPTPRAERSSEWVSVNYLLSGDRGFTVPEMFALVEGAGLEHFRMVGAQDWRLEGLFSDLSGLPESLLKLFADCTPREQLHLVELLEGSERLLDFWCGHPGSPVPPALADLGAEVWSQARIRLHPQLGTLRLRADLVEALATGGTFDFNRYLRKPSAGEIVLDAAIAQGLLPLWEGPMALDAFLEQWVAQIREKSPALEVEPLIQELRQFVAFAEGFAYLIVER